MQKNKHHNIISISILSFLLLLSICLQQRALADQNAQANEFIKAYDALSKGKFYESDHLKGYILHPYLEYERIKNNLNKTADKTLISFVNQNRDNWLGSDINTELLQRFAKQNKWGNVLKYYQKGKGGNKAKCIGIEAQLRTRPSQALLNESLKLWKSGNRRPKVCNPLFSLLKQNNARNRQIVAYGIKRIARKKTNSARQKWKQVQRQYTFSQETKADVESYIAVRDAKDHKAIALKEFAAIPAQLRSDDANVWMARLALRFGDWRKLRAAIGSMKVEDKNRDRWRYWLAQSNKKLNNKNIQPELQVVARNASFYGFLAADELNAPYSRLLQQERNWSSLTPKIKNIKSIQRATELFSLGMPKLAKKEWKWAMQDLNKNDQLIAAAYAHEINQPFQAIVTVSGTKDWNQVGLRFPLQYETLVKKAARDNRVSPAWVYGVMRRESAFDPVIKSHANARGLMQVLPATAKGVAKSLGIRHKTSDLYIPEKNANIGAAYLSQMLKRFKGNYIKATASYNAGPHRIPRWLPKQRISAPRWIESIPFDETRNYVRAVMSYTTIYDHKLHYRNRSNLRLSKRLQSINPK